MSLFVLREGIRVVSAPTGGRLVDLHAGKAIDLSPEEVQLLARASARGLDSKDPSLRPLLERLAEEGMIRQRPAKADAPEAPAPDAAKVPTADDVAPKFLGSLKVQPQATSALVQISDPVTGKTANLYDFEVSIARMLDGKRTCQEVVDAGQNIGIPVNLASLGQFLRQLRAYGFLEDPKAPANAVELSPWPARERWSLEVRDLFRNGMRLFRVGNYLDALSVLEEVLKLDPNNAEAAEIYQKARARVTSADAEPAEADGEIANEGGLDDVLFESTGDSVLHTAPQIEVIRKNQTIARMMAALRRATGVHSLELKHVGIAAGVLLALALGATMLLSRGSKAKRDAPEAAAPAPASEEKTAAAPEPSTAVAQDTPSTEAHADAGAEPVAQAAAASGPQVELKLLSRRRVSLGKVKAPSAGKVSWSVQSATRVKKGDALGFVAVKSKHVPLKASKEGVLLPRATEGATVKRGAIVAELVYGKAILQAEVAGARPTAKWSCEVTDPASGQRADCAIFKVVPKGTGALVTGTTEPLWFDAAAAPVVRLTPP